MNQSARSYNPLISDIELLSNERPFGLAYNRPIDRPLYQGDVVIFSHSKLPLFKISVFKKRVLGLAYAFPCNKALRRLVWLTHPARFGLRFSPADPAYIECYPCIPPEKGGRTPDINNTFAKLRLFFSRNPLKEERSVWLTLLISFTSWSARFGLHIPLGLAYAFCGNSYFSGGSVWLTKSARFGLWSARFSLLKRSVWLTNPLGLVYRSAWFGLQKQGLCS